jgi:hypothetical protein
MNQHNPIAYAISQLQNKWIEKTYKKDFKFVRWIIEKSNLDIFKGFLKLESSPHGSLNETYIVMFTPFENKHGYSYSLMNDWIELFEHEGEKGNLKIWDEIHIFKEKLLLLTPENINKKDDSRLLLLFLESFYKYIAKEEKLVVVLLPQGILNNNEYVSWLDEIINYLPKQVALMTLDFENNEIQNKLFKNENLSRISILATGLFNSGDIYKKLATSGNPDDPQVAFRTCMFEMGEAAKNNNLKGVNKFGEKILLITQMTGDKLFWASAHIVYSGFLFGFKENDKIHQLLDNGINICEQLLTDDTKKIAASGLLAQFFSYKASYFNIQKKYSDSILYFEKQADILIEYDQKPSSIGAFQNALLVASKHKNSKIEEIATRGFNIAYPLPDDLLRTSGFPIIVFYYLKYCSEKNEKIKEIETRMDYLYTDQWKKYAKKHLAIAPEEYVS